MGNYPSEYYGVTCQCGRDLPPCKTWDGFTEGYIDRKVDRVYAYTFLGGRYYRIKGYSTYYCPDCFWRPKKEYEREKEERERRKKEAQRRREEEERKKREEEARRRRQEKRRQEQLRREREEHERMLEQLRLEDLRKREQEAERERARKMAILEEERRRDERRKKLQRLAEERKQQAKLNFEHQLSNKKTLGQRLLTWQLNNETENIKETVEMQSYRPQFHSMTILGATSGPGTPTLSNQAEALSSGMTKVSLHDDEVQGYSIDDSAITEELISMVDEMEPDDTDLKWLHAVQTHMLCYYSRRNRFSEMEEEILFFCLTNVRAKLGKEDCLYLTKLFCELANSHALDYTWSGSMFSDDLTGKFLCKLLHYGFEYSYANTACMEQCFNTLILAKVGDIQLQNMIVEASSSFWSTYDRYIFLQRCNQNRLSIADQKCIMHLIQTYDISPYIVDEAFTAFEAGHSASIVSYFDQSIQNEPNKGLADILTEMRSSGLVDGVTLDQVQSIMTLVEKKIMNPTSGFHMHLDYERFLTYEAIKYAQSVIKLGTDAGLQGICDAISTLACAVQKTKGICPRTTQLAALTLLIISQQNSVSRLLEVLTGEGKSCIIAMFAAVLGM